MSLEIKVPELGESISQASIASIKVKDGQIVAQDELLFEIETDKVTLEVTAPEQGKITLIAVSEEDIVKSGAMLCSLLPLSEQELSNHNLKQEKDTNQQSNVSEPKQEQKALKEEAKQAPSTPDTKIKEGVKLKVFKDTVEVFLDKQLKKVASTSCQNSLNTNPDREPVEGEKKVAMTAIRKKIASNLKFSQESSVSLTTFNEVNLTSLLSVRKNINSSQEIDAKLGITSFFIKAVSNAIKKFPIINAEIAGDSIIYKNYHDIGVAVGTNYGLVVPNIRNCENKTILQIEKDLTEFVVKANKRQLNIEDITQGSFTISNGGVYGSLLSTPIINPPQVAILGLHAINKKPIVDSNNNIVIASVMNLALTYDHRIIDGKEAVSFLQTVKKLVETPETLLFEV